MKTRVIDSWAILEWMAGRDPARGVVRELFSEADRGAVTLLMSAINAGEVYYSLQKSRNPALAESWRESSRTLPATIEVPTAEDIWNAAALKGRFPIAYADAFAGALAQKYKCPLVTGDPELRSVDQLEIDWIGRGAKR